MLSNIKCKCGEALVEKHINESSVISPDTANIDFKCTDEECGRCYSIEYTNISSISSCTECNGEIEMDDDSTEENICPETINTSVACTDCGHSEEVEYTAIEVTEIEREEPH